MNVLGKQNTPQPILEVDDEQKPLISGSPSSESAHAVELPPLSRWRLFPGLASFWHDRLIEVCLVLSLALYYVIGTANLGTGGSLFHIPYFLYALPFLAFFAFFSWYRLAFSLALLPLSLPFYEMHKPVWNVGSHSFAFSLVEIALTVCLLVALGQILARRQSWPYWLTWADLRDRIGPFLWPIAVFVSVALISLVPALDRSAALLTFREEILNPLLYLLLALCCLRTRQDLLRLLSALLTAALIVALIGLIQYFFFVKQLELSWSGNSGRVKAMYGSANSIGLFFDYVVPFAFALFLFQVGRALRFQGSRWVALLLLAFLILLAGVLFLSQSLGVAVALPVALLFIMALSVRNRKVRFIGAGVLLVLLLSGSLVLHKQILDLLTNWHKGAQGQSTVATRVYLWLTAWHMIQDFPWFGVGLNNWLCHYTPNTTCLASYHVPSYLVQTIPGTSTSTGLIYQPDLAHPHDIFLQIWVSIGIFRLLAFVTLLGMFFWLFARIIRVVCTVRQTSSPSVASLKWLVLGVVGAMLAALCQGLVARSFLEQ